MRTWLRGVKPFRVFLFHLVDILHILLKNPHNLVFILPFIHMQVVVIPSIIILLNEFFKIHFSFLGNDLIILLFINCICLMSFIFNKVKFFIGLYKRPVLLLLCSYLWDWLSDVLGQLKGGIIRDENIGTMFVFSEQVAFSFCLECLFFYLWYIL